MTAKQTANFADAGEQTWTILEPEAARSNCGGPRRTPVDASPAVFKTVSGLCESKGRVGTLARVLY